MNRIIKGKKHGSHSKKEAHQSKREYFDQQEQNFDALEMQEHQDPEYNALLKSSAPHANKRKNAYFFNNEKYKGTKQLQEDQDQVEEESSPQSEQNNQIAGAIKIFREERKRESKLLTEDVQKINKEDEQYEVMRKQQKTSEETLEEAVGLRNQLNCQRMLVDFRYSQQNSFELLKRFPTSNYPNNRQLHNIQKELEQCMFKNLNKLIEVYSKYSENVFGSESLKTQAQKYQEQIAQNQESRLDIGSVNKSFTEQQEIISRSTEKQLIKWSHKTSLINISSSHYSSLLMQTPVGQAKKILSNWERARTKCQQKRNTFKILFQDEENVRTTSDPQIFDDYQLFTQFEKSFISEVQDEQNFRASDTLRYLKNREGRGEKSKEVDRKASKNRKLRFNVHQKLLNFIPSYPANLIEARDGIVDNFFNCRSRQVPVEKGNQEGETYYIDL